MYHFRALTGQTKPSGEAEVDDIVEMDNCPGVKESERFSGDGINENHKVCVEHGRIKRYSGPLDVPY